MRYLGRWLNPIPFWALCLGCSSQARVTDVAYLVVIDSMAETVPADSHACFASGFYPEGSQDIPASLRDSLLSRGWALHDPVAPFDTAARLFYVAEARPVEEGFTILAGISGVYQTRDGLAIWGEDRLFRLSCEDQDCRVVRVEDRTHWDAIASRDVTSYISAGRGTCQASVPLPGTGGSG